MRYTLRRVEPADRPVVERLLVKDWGAVEVFAVALGGIVDASELPGWIASADGEVAGLLTYRVDGDTLDIVTINAYRSGGVGAALVEKAVGSAREAGAARIRVTTTNDNTRALRFYQRCGFRLIALRPGVVDEARKHKPEITELGLDDIPIRDELDLELRVDPGQDG